MPAALRIGPDVGTPMSHIPAHRRLDVAPTHTGRHDRNDDGYDTAVSFVVEGGRISRIYAVRNPEKLGRIDAEATISRQPSTRVSARANRSNQIDWQFAPIARMPSVAGESTGANCQSIRTEVPRTSNVARRSPRRVQPLHTYGRCPRLPSDAPPSLLHQRHAGRVLRSPGDPRGRELHRHAVDNLQQADALLFGRVTYQLMEGGGPRPPCPTGRAPSPRRSTQRRSASCRAP